jgi:hypothetical protein
MSARRRQSRNGDGPDQLRDSCRFVLEPRSLAGFEGNEKLFLVLVEPSQHRIGKLAVHFDVCFARQVESVRRPSRPRVAVRFTANSKEPKFQA